MKRIMLLVSCMLVCFGLLSAQSFEWIQTAGYPMANISATDISGHGVAVDGQGNVYVAGTFHDTTTFDSKQLVTDSKGDVFIAKYSGDGTIQWVKQISNDQELFVGDIAVDAAGNSYITGAFNSTTSFDGEEVVSDKATGYTPTYDFYVVSFGPDGTRRWVQTSTGLSVAAFTSVASNSSGQVVIMGSHNGVITLGGKSTANKGYFIGQLNTADGTLAWLTEDGTGIIPSTVYGGIAIDGSGNVAIHGAGGFLAITIGSTQVTGGFFTAYYDNTGALQWVKTVTGTGFLDSPQAVAFDAAGNVYTGGSVTAAAVFDTETADTTGGYVAKYSSAGAIAWVKSITSSGVAGVSALAGGAGKVSAAGYFQITVKFGTDSLTTSAGQNSCFMADYADDGTVTPIAAGKTSQEIRATDICTDASANLYMTGMFRRHIGFGDIADTASTKSGQGALPEMFVLKYGSGASIADHWDLPGTHLHFTIQPNPVPAGQFSCNLGKEANIRLLDLRGNPVSLKRTGTSISLPQHTPAGIYLLEVNGYPQQKVFVQ